MYLNKYIRNNFLIFIIIAIWYATGNLIWWVNNTPVVLTGDSATHFLDIFEKGWLFYNAPLITWIMRGIFFIFGTESYDLQIIFVNYVFFLIPLYFIYKIGYELKDKETGNIAMILFALVPAVYGMSRQYGHKDYQIIAAITFNIYCLIKTDYFRDRKWGIWYGISVGLGLMIKDEFLAYFFVPFAYIATAGLREKADKDRIINILLAAAAGSLISGWHYFRLEIIRKILCEPVTETGPVFVFNSLRVMTIGLWEELLSPPIFIIFVIGLIYFIWKYKGKYKNIILLWFFVPWTIIMVMPHRKLIEYGAGFVPAIMLICSIFIASFQKTYVKKLVIILLITIGLLQYMNFSYSIININLFNLKWQNKNLYIEYWHKKNDLIFYKDEIELTLNLVNYFKNKYETSKIYILDNVFYCNMILGQMYLNNMIAKKGCYNKTDILYSDIIAIIGDLKEPESIFAFKIKNNLLEPVDKNFKNKLFEKMQIISERVYEKYHEVGFFYPDERKTDETKITLLGRKNKFY